MPFAVGACWRLRCREVEPGMSRDEQYLRNEEATEAPRRRAIKMSLEGIRFYSFFGRIGAKEVGGGEYVYYCF